MVLRATKFTPEVLLSAPRRSPGVPDPTGEKVLFTVSSYSFAAHRKTSQIRVLDIASGTSTLLYEDPAFSEPVWVGPDAFLFLQAGDAGSTSLLLGRASEPGTTPTVLQTFDGGLSNLKVLPLADGAVAIGLTGLADPAGALYNPEKRPPAYTTARIYDKLFVRHWDTYVTENRQAVFYGRLELAGLPGGYALRGLANALAGTPLESPVPTFGGAGDYDLGPHGIVFVSRDPAHNDATSTVTNLYFAPLVTYAEPRPLAPPYALRTGALSGYSASPVFSPDGQRIAFTRMQNPQYESDKPRLLLVPDIAQLGAGASDVVEFYATPDGAGGWDARTDTIVWSADSTELFVTAEYHGRNGLYRLPADPEEAAAHGTPEQVVGGHELLAAEAAEAADPVEDETTGFRRLRGHGSVTAVRRLASGVAGDARLFVTLSSLIDSSLFTILDPAPTTARVLQVVSSVSRHGATFGLSPQQIGEIWFRGAGDYDVQALVVRPSDFSAAKNAGRRWPLALLLHGGPQGAWTNSWSTRWNPAVFAEQGYVVVAPNPTGSTGYGMALEDGIQHEWGGRPYHDLERAMDHIATALPYVDVARAVALGASYGGYMINWIQGHPLGRRFQALVNHDGVFSTLNQYASEELFFPLHDFGGTLWENRAGYERWDPARFTSNWATPTLIIHNELDYRLPITEGLAAFNVLQSRGVPSRFLSFPDENHWVLKPENSLTWHKEVLAWINKYSGVEQ